jgi:predicted membrane protein
MNPRRRSPVTPGTVFGAIAVVLGVLLLLRNFGYIRYFSVDIFPLLLLVLGLASLLGGSSRPGRVGGGVLSVIGGYWLASNLGLAPYRFRDVWPAALILLGLFFLWRALSHPRQAADALPEGRINETVVFGGGKKTIASQRFRGGEIYAFCGGHEIDFRPADIDGEVAVIDATAVLGGVELRIPENWDLSVEGAAVFGGYEDKTSHPREGDATKRLVVRGLALFGGVEVKN